MKLTYRMRTAFIFHGTDGHPQENWFPWLKKELESLDYKVIVPQFPTPENQTLDNWFEVFEKHREDYSQDTILIGHSLGGAFLLRVLERYDVKIHAAYIVAAPIGVLPIKNYDGDKLFIGHPFEWEKIKDRAQRFQVFHSDDDPYVSLGNGQELSNHLGIKLTFVPSAGHFNAPAGYTKFDLLLNSIQKEK